MKPSIFFKTNGDVFYFVKSCPELGINWPQDHTRAVFFLKIGETYQPVNAFGMLVQTFLKEYTFEQIALLALLGYVTKL